MEGGAAGAERKGDGAPVFFGTGNDGIAGRTAGETAVGAAGTAGLFSVVAWRSGGLAAGGDGKAFAAVSTVGCAAGITFVVPLSVATLAVVADVGEYGRNVGLVPACKPRQVASKKARVVFTVSLRWGLWVWREKRALRRLAGLGGQTSPRRPALLALAWPGSSVSFGNWPPA